MIPNLTAFKMSYKFMQARQVTIQVLTLCSLLEHTQFPLTGKMPDTQQTAKSEILLHLSV